MNKSNSLYSKPLSIPAQLLGLILPALLSFSVTAGTLVKVESTIGEFTLELFDDEAPAAVAQFLANIEAGTYQFTMVHFASPTLFAGGVYFYNSCSQGPVEAPSIPTAPSPGTTRANTTGTIAMVPVTGATGTLGGQWVINLGNNDGLYSPATRPVVFGEIVAGLDIADRISTLWRVSMNISPAVPTVNYDGIEVIQCGFFNRDNIVRARMEVLPDPVAVNSFDNATGLLNISVDAGDAGLLSLSLLLQTLTPTAIVEVQPETVSVLTEAVDGMATFNSANNELYIPELFVDGQVAYRNLIFSLTDAENLIFTLLSAEVASN